MQTDVQTRDEFSKRLIIPVKGMTCAVCSGRIERVLKAAPGVKEISVSLASGLMDVKWDDSVISAQELAEKVNNLGFEAILPEPEQESTVGDETEALWQVQQRDLTERLEAMRKKLVPALIFAAVVAYISMAGMLNLRLPSSINPALSPLDFALAQLCLSLPVLWAGRDFYRHGILNLWRLSPTMDSLVALGTGAALVYSLWSIFEIAAGIPSHGNGAHGPDLYFEAATMLLALVLLGKYLELRSRGKAFDALRALMDLAPKFARRLKSDGTDEEVPLAEVRAGDHLLIRPGEKIPVDGIVEEGHSAVDESLLSGESLPVPKEPGAPLSAGSVNGEGSLTMRATRVGADTTIARIIRLVREAQGSKAPIANLADQVSRYFVPVVMVIAVLSALGWYFAGASPSFCLRILVAVLVIACPCAMGLATPISLMVGMGRGAQLGVLIKNGSALENLGRLNMLVMDKTGTLTEGRPKLADFIPIGHGVAENVEELKFAAASLERLSEHPLARAMVESVNKDSVFWPVENFKASPGGGVAGQVKTPQGNRNVLMGRLEFLADNGVSFDGKLSNDGKDSLSRADVEANLDILAAKGRSSLLMAVDGRPVALLGFADPLRPDAPKLVNELRRDGIRVMMLTGDKRLTAEYLAKEAGIDEVAAEVLPQDKDAVVASLADQGLVVGMVGDGVNDAPALARAHVGMAMGGGIDVAMEAGDVVLMRGRLADIHTAMALSRATMRNIRQNLFWAFGYNALGIPVAAGLLHIFGGPTMSPMLAGAAMALSSVSVVTNALRLKAFKA